MKSIKWIALISALVSGSIAHTAEPALPLAGDTATASRTCRFGAIFAGMRPDQTLSPSAFSGATYFTILESRETKGKKGLLDRVNEIASAQPEDGLALYKIRAEIKESCESRFPKSVEGTPVVLPKVAFERATLCSSVGSFLASAIATADPKAADWIFAVVEDYKPALTDAELKKQNLDEDGFLALTNAMLEKSLDIGNPLTIMNACKRR